MQRRQQRPLHYCRRHRLLCAYLFLLLLHSVVVVERTGMISKWSDVTNSGVGDENIDVLMMMTTMMRNSNSNATRPNVEARSFSSSSTTTTENNSTYYINTNGEQQQQWSLFMEGKRLPPTTRSTSSTTTSTIRQGRCCGDANSTSRSANSSCYCHRNVFVVHKMGYEMILSILKEQINTDIVDVNDDNMVHMLYISEDEHNQNRFHQSITTMTNILQQQQQQKQLDDQGQQQDYRSVIVTRDFVKSLISGYFYHRSGRECTLDHFGEPIETGWLRVGRYFERLLLYGNHSQPHNLPYRPIRQRTLCRYLQQVSPQHGFRVYVEFAYLIYFKPLIETYYEPLLEAETKLATAMATESLAAMAESSSSSSFPSNNNYKTIHLCYEDILKNHTWAVQEIEQHMFGGPRRHHGHGHGDLLPTTTTMMTTANNNNTHTVPKDESLVKDLSEYFVEIDMKLFNGQLSKWNTRLGCGI